MKSKEFIQGLIEYLKNNLNIPDENCNNKLNITS